MKTYYNVHNIVKIKIEAEDFIIKEYDYYLRDFKVDKLEGVDIEIFGDKKNSLKIENGKMIVSARDNELCVNALIQYILLQKGCTFIHSAGVSYKDKGIIFPAGPNVGKTLLISRLREKDIKFFGDDYLILKDDGTMLSYPMDFSIYDYHFDFFKELKETANVKRIKKAGYERVIVNIIKNLPIKRLIKKLARFLRYDYLQAGQYLKIPARQLIPQEKFGKSTEIKYSLFLIKGNEFKVEKMDSVDREMVEILQSEWKKTLPFLSLDFNRTKEVIKKSLNNAELYKITLPEKKEERLNKLEEFLEEIWNR